MAHACWGDAAPHPADEAAVDKLKGVVSSGRDVPLRHSDTDTTLRVFEDVIAVCDRTSDVVTLVLDAPSHAPVTLAPASLLCVIVRTTAAHQRRAPVVAYTCSGGERAMRDTLVDLVREWPDDHGSAWDGDDARRASVLFIADYGTNDHP